MDAFFASAELLRHPELLGKPVVVGGDGPRGVVAAASYEARAFGIFSAMSSARAKARCPHAVFLHGDHRYYASISSRIMELLRDVTPMVEPLSLDEAFCDISGALRKDDDPGVLARHVREHVFAETRLWCAAGVAPSKFVAKLASKAAKPRVGKPGSGPLPGAGVVVVSPSEQLEFLHPMPVRAIWGVGPATVKQLEALGVTTIGALAALPRIAVERRLGPGHGGPLWDMANGIDTRPVVSDREPKSIGHEETYRDDLTDRERMVAELTRLADATAQRVHEHGTVARTVQVKIRFADFSTITRAETLQVSTDSRREIAAAAKRIFSRVVIDSGVRLLGVSVFGLSAPGGNRQMSFEDIVAENYEQADAAIDAIRDRFGVDAIASAALLINGEIDVRRRGDQQWGRDR